MEVTQHEIDAAITKANESLRKLYLSIETTLKAGYALPEEKIQQYNNLKEALFLLEHSSDLLAQDCITTKDVWIQINFVTENSFIC